MEGRAANPRALGFGAFAIGAWMYSMIDAGWFEMSTYASGTSQSVAVFAMIALLVAAIAAFLRDEAWHALFFAFWAALFWGFSGVLDMGPGDSTYGGWHSLMIAVFSLLLWLSAGKSDVALPDTLVAAGVTVTFAAWGLAGLLGVDLLNVAGGYVGLLTALASFWATADAMPGGAPGPAGGPASGTAGTSGTREGGGMP